MSGPVVPFTAVDGAEGAVRRSTFNDAGHQRGFAELGYAVVPFLDRTTMASVKAIWDRLGPAPGDDRTGFFSGTNSNSLVWKRAVIDAVAPLVDERLAELFDRHHRYHITFLTKWPGPTSQLALHQDPTMVGDEARFHGATLWCPLDQPRPEEPDRGMLRVVPRSHRLEIGSWYRARGHVHSGFENVEEVMTERFVTPVTFEPGDALVFDHRLIHGSPPNRSELPRHVLGIGLRPEEARNVHIECSPQGWVDVYAVDDEYFVINPHVGQVVGYPRTFQVFHQPPPEVTLEALEALEGVPAPSSGTPPTAGRPVEVSPPPVAAAEPAMAETAAAEPAAAEPVAAVEPGADGPPVAIVAAVREEVAPRDWIAPFADASPMRREAPAVLVDAELDRRLRRDGFAHVPGLLSRQVADDLREEFGRLHGWEGDGFVVDFWSPDVAYRREVSAAIAAATDGPLKAVFVDHSPFLRNFLVKWPGVRDPDEFPELPHRDWMYTDERAGVKSWVVWLALEDIDGHNGQLQVARGSHRLDMMLRGPNIETPWLAYRDIWRPRMLSIPTRAGDAIVLDAAVVHSSHSNLGVDPRVAAAIALRPTGAQLTHFRRHDDDLAARYDVDEEFFVTQETSRLMGEGPDLPVRELVPIGGIALSPRVLTRRLDLQPLALLNRAEQRARGLRSVARRWDRRPAGS